ncbi:MAG: deoxyribonuclease IV [Thermodesulfovibrionales bacterium]|nr:deoxyribonuclease IV [Thermodesulfovibrionales bacterium]
MRKLGVHTSISGGLHLSLERAHALGCTTMQIFSHNPRGWAVKEITAEAAAQFISLRAQYDISPVYIHASYLINLATHERMLQKKSVGLLIEEMNRADAIGAEYVILHAGSSSTDAAQVARKRAIGALNVVARQGKWRVGLLIENTAGERGDISSLMTELSEIMEGVHGSLIGGVCIDTAHAFAAGYNIRSAEGAEILRDEILRYLGQNSVKLIHLNDSKRAAGSHVDRHEHIGCGNIGSAGLRQFITGVHFSGIPLILETPKKNDSDDIRNLRRVRKMLEREL